MLPPIDVAARFKQLREDLGLSVRQAAAVAGMHPSTYQHYEDAARFNKRTLPMELAKAFAAEAARRGRDPDPFLALAGVEPALLAPGGGFADVEMVRYQPEPAGRDPVDAAILALTLGRPNAAPWLIRGRALDRAGYLPGGIVVVDHGTDRARRHQVVCAQVYENQGGEARTVLRLYEPPYLIADSADPAYRRPQLVGPDLAVILGVAVAALRRIDPP